MDRVLSLLPVAVGVAAIASVVALAVFLVIRGPFGTVNDLLNAVLAVLSAVLAWRLSGLGPLTYIAFVGAVIALVGSALVISETTGFFLAGLVSSLGFSLIGLWLLAYAWSMGDGVLRWLGLAAGALMTLGVLVIPGIVMRLDDMDKAPAWIWVGFVSWLGIYVAYPAWAIWSGLTNQPLR